MSTTLINMFLRKCETQVQSAVGSSKDENLSTRLSCLTLLKAFDISKETATSSSCLSMAPSYARCPVNRFRQRKTRIVGHRVDHSILGIPRACYSVGTRSTLSQIMEKRFSERGEIDMSTQELQ